MKKPITFIFIIINLIVWVFFAIQMPYSSISERIFIFFGLICIGGTITLISAYILLKRRFFSQWYFKLIGILGTFVFEIFFFALFVLPLVSAAQRVGHYHSSEFYFDRCQNISPEVYGAKSYEDVHIKTNDGVLLNGWFVPPLIPSRAVVILVHGDNTNRCGTDVHGEELIKAGYGVLFYDLRGYSSTSVEPRSFVLNSTDLLSVVKFLSNRADVNKEHIGILGLSYGTHAAIQAAALDQSHIAAMWLDGLYPNTLEEYPAVNGFDQNMRKLAGAFSFELTMLLQGHSSPPSLFELLPNITHPKIMLVAAGKVDIEADANKLYMDSMGQNAEIWIVEQSFHVGGISNIHEEYTAKMLEFFNSSLSQ